MNRILPLFFGLLSYSICAQKSGIFVDPKDNRAYATITYKISDSKYGRSEITWFAENLSFSTPGSRCYQYNSNDCVRFYQWEEAMNSCPSGWRLPSNSDWLLLVNLYGGMKKAGRHLKAKDREWVGGKGTNKSRFSGKPYGASDGTDYFHLGYATFFWSATTLSEAENEAYDWSFVTNSPEIRQWVGDKLIYNSVRCIKE